MILPKVPQPTPTPTQRIKLGQNYIRGHLTLREIIFISQFVNFLKRQQIMDLEVEDLDSLAQK